MKRARVRFNYGDYLLLPEDKRYEILDGDLYMVPAPNTKHQGISKKLEMALIQYAEANGIGEVFDAPYDVILSEEDIVQPDILLVCKERAGIIGAKNLQGAPDLVVEILSEGTRGKDTEVKRKIYAAFGVAEYWIVDPEAETVEVLLLSEAGYVTASTCHKFERLSSPLLPQLDLPLVEVFTTP